MAACGEKRIWALWGIDRWRKKKENTRLSRGRGVYAATVLLQRSHLILELLRLGSTFTDIEDFAKQILVFIHCHCSICQHKRSKFEVIYRPLNIVGRYLTSMPGLVQVTSLARPFPSPTSQIRKTNIRLGNSRDPVLGSRFWRMDNCQVLQRFHGDGKRQCPLTRQHMKKESAHGGAGPGTSRTTCE